MFGRKRRVDRIRKLSIRELSRLFDEGAGEFCPKSIDGQVYCKYDSCVPCIEKWLREVEK